MKKAIFLLLLIMLTACTNKPKYPPNDFDNFPSMHYEEATQKFSESNKPTLLFFNSIACVNCRKTEQMLTKKIGLQRIKEKYNLINLYVDDQEILPSNQWKKHRNKTKKRKGQINAILQTELTQTGSQPYLVLPQDTTLIPYTPNLNELIELLGL